MPGPEWKDTKLWKELKRRSAEPDAGRVRTTLEAILPAIETILRSDGLSTDFTLHDDGHAFRVAQRMVEVMPDGMCAHLSVYELALLLLSAYLHDIGMSPERRRVSDIYTYVLDGDRAEISEEEVNSLQAWVDDDARQVNIPLCKDAPPSTDELRLAQELTAHYCRHRHNEWSAEYIQEALSGKTLGTYQTWVSDLIALCKSHHEGHDVLGGTRFDPRPVGSPAQTVHLRYLASVLRVADILEFDPERTPDVIFRHRDVSKASALHWYKDHAISSKFDSERSLHITARPGDAQLHKAILTMADDIERELELVSRLDDETHFGVGLGPDTLPHRWDLNPRVRRDVRELDGKYVFIDGAFRPNTDKLLQLLGGLELYEDPKAAVRDSSRTPSTPSASA